MFCFVTFVNLVAEIRRAIVAVTDHSGDLET